MRAEDVRRTPAEYDERSTTTGLRINRRGPCFDYGAYVPDTLHPDHLPVKYIRLNIHWMQPLEAVADFPEEKARAFSLGLLKACNYALANNKPMWLPYRNNTPTLPIGIQYVLTPRPNEPDDDAIYFHYDDELYYYVAKGKDRNLYDRAVFNKYGVQLDTVLNLFIMPHHPDSLRSKNYKGVGTGVALGNAVKLAGIDPSADFWPFRGVFNHEMGHIFGLSHAWAYNDGCEDTPTHSLDCWNRSQPGCDTTTSNNVMDYNAMQLAWSPCQIGKVHQRMSDTSANARKLLVPTWCRLDEDKTIVIRDTVSWEGARDLEGNLVIAPGGRLTVKCRLSIPPKGRITVEPGGVLVLDGPKLHNACGEEWLGIEIRENNKLAGMVQVIQDPVFENVRKQSVAPAR